MLRWLSSFFISFGMLSACAQVPTDRPLVRNPDFDQRLTKLLSFSVPLIGVEELHQQAVNYLILDTRELEEYAVSHLPGAQFYGYNKPKPDVLENVPRNQPIVLYCSVGYRSEKIGEDLRKQGFTNVKNLYGSIFAWANAGYPLENNKGTAVKKVHTYNAKWGQWVDERMVEKVH